MGDHRLYLGELWSPEKAAGDQWPAMVKGGAGPGTIVARAFRARDNEHRRVLTAKLREEEAAARDATATDLAALNSILARHTRALGVLLYGEGWETDR